MSNAALEAVKPKRLTVRQRAAKCAQSFGVNSLEEKAYFILGYRSGWRHALACAAKKRRKR